MNDSEAILDSGGVASDTRISLPSFQECCTVHEGSVHFFPFFVFRTFSIRSRLKSVRKPLASHLVITIIIFLPYNGNGNMSSDDGKVT